MKIFKHSAKIFVQFAKVQIKQNIASHDSHHITEKCTTYLLWDFWKMGAFPNKIATLSQISSFLGSNCSAESPPLVNGLPEGKTITSLQQRHLIITFAQDHKNKRISVSEKPRTAGGESSVNRFSSKLACLYMFANNTKPYQSIKLILPPILFLFRKYWNSCV